MEVQVVVNVQFERAWTPSQQVRKCKKRKNPCRICAEKNEKHTRERTNIKKHKNTHQRTPTNTNTRKHTQMHQNAPKGLTPPLFWTQRKRKNLFVLQLLHEKPSCLVILVHLALLPRRLGAKVQKNEISRVKLVILVPWGWPPFPVKQYQATTKTTFFLEVFFRACPVKQGNPPPPLPKQLQTDGATGTTR